VARAACLCFARCLAAATGNADLAFAFSAYVPHLNRRFTVPAAVVLPSESTTVLVEAAANRGLIGVALLVSPTTTGWSPFPRLAQNF
jgi:hypothetical protein